MDDLCDSLDTIKLAEKQTEDIDKVLETRNIVGLFAFHINHVISKSRHSSRKEVVHASYSFNNSLSDIECRN